MILRVVLVGLFLAGPACAALLSGFIRVKSYSGDERVPVASLEQAARLLAESVLRLRNAGTSR